MLDPWIIEEIRRREQERRERSQPTVIELPLHGPAGDVANDRSERQKPANDDPPRGVAIIEYGNVGSSYGYGGLDQQNVVY
jgi:hypothetical protein